jgi:hypothetical protein
MTKRFVYLKGATIIIFLMIITACTKDADINKEDDVIKSIQGAWVGYEKIGNMYKHVKLSIDKDLFEVWVQTSDSQNKPSWAKLPDEKGAVTLNSLQKDPNMNLRFRKFSFTCSGRCCGDKSSVIKDISDMISYDEGKGLTLNRKIKMSKI